MKHKRKKYQNGSIVKRKRKTGPPTWEFSYIDHSQMSARKTVLYSTLEYPTKRDVLTAVQPLLLRVNGSDAFRAHTKPTVGVVVERFITEERLREIVRQPVGQAFSGGLKYSTAVSYLSILTRQILPRWEGELIAAVKPVAINEWLLDLQSKPIGDKAPRPLSPRTKGHIKALFHRLYEKAMLWGLLDVARNPLELVEVKGVSKRTRKPKILTVEQYAQLVACLVEPYRTMVVVAMCLGLRVNELLALKWSDFDFNAGVVHVERGVVHGRISTVKTEYSEDDLPIDPLFAAELMEWRIIAPQSEAGWLFVNPSTERLYHADPIQQDYIRRAGTEIGLSWSVGWHTFRHTHRSLLDDTGAPLGVQQKLMRHASIQTTMSYGNAYIETKRHANSNVVSRILTQKGESRASIN